MATAAPTLEGRLICACSCTYAVVKGEDTLDPNSIQPYYDGVGYKNPPTAFLDGLQDIDSCLVGTTADGVVVAFRGTLSLEGPFTLPKLIDWMNDLNVHPVPWDTDDGEVHAGFLGSLNSLWPKVRDEVKRQLAAAGVGTQLIITGHSKGGAVAGLAAMRFFQKESIKPKVITFAAAKAGNAEFAESYSAAIDHARYEFAEDIVPHLPPSAPLLTVLSKLPFVGSRLTHLDDFDYGRLGKLIYITRDLQFINDPDNSLLDERRERILKLIILARLQRVGDDHRISCESGYMTAICPTGVCPQ